MEKTITRPPDGARATRKALVVELDYFALTSRVDKNVIFWAPGIAKVHSAFPKGVTHLWLSKYVSAEVRLQLSELARRQGIQVWRCSIPELCERLLGFWAEPTNRSLVRPAQPDQTAEKELDGIIRVQISGESFGEIKGMASALTQAVKRQAVSTIDEGETEEETVDSADDEAPRLVENPRLALLRSAQKRYKRRLKKKAKKNTGMKQPLRFRPRFVPRPVEAPKPFTSLEAMAELQRQLRDLPRLERVLFEYHYGLKEGAGIRTIAQTALNFRLPEDKATDVLKRAWQRLSQSGIRIQEHELLAAKSS